MNLDNATQTNATGKTFDVENIVVTNASSNSGSGGELLGSFSLKRVEYRKRTYINVLTAPKGLNYKQTVTFVTQRIVSIQASNISHSNSFSKIEVEGNWWVTKVEGRTPVVLHGIFPSPKDITQYGLLQNDRRI